MLIETIKHTKLSKQEFINDILNEHWDTYNYQCDVENCNPYAEYILARGQFIFDSIEFDTGFGHAIYLFNAKNKKEHFLSIGGRDNTKDDAIDYVEKEMIFNKCTNSISAIYIVHFVETEQVVKFGAYKEK
ncbi:MAG: hypothetical protein IJE43_22145 [Alphaproteobacteria bacterium]|nr:hypothetical protein [Alphaproteobacteria bacterium]MBQ3512518.1 hypothetical protein [Lachnospiraceae bacterium]